MNHNLFEKFIHDLEAIRMDQEAKDTMRRELAAFAYQYQPQVSPYHMLFVRMRQGAAFALALLLVLGGVSKGASAGALPGEILYPVKLIHEEIKSATTTNTEDKISFEIKRTETRIKEAAQLAQSEKLDSKKQAELAKDIKKHTEKVRSDIKKVQAEDPQQALSLNSEMKTTLKLNNEALKQVAEGAKEKKAETAPAPEETTLATLPINELDITLENIEVIEEEDVVTLLIGSIEEEVIETEALALEVENQIISEKDISDEEVSDTPDTQKETDSKDVEQKIDYLEQVLKIEAEIQSIKDELKEIRKETPVITQAPVIEEVNTLELPVPEEVIPEEQVAPKEIVVDLAPEGKTQIQIIRAEADALVAAKKYGQAFIKLQTILERYQAQLVGEQIERELNVDVVDDLSEEEIIEAVVEVVEEIQEEQTPETPEEGVTEETKNA